MIFFDIQRFNVINNDLNNVTIAGTAIADTIINTGSNVTIDGVGGNDYIFNNAIFTICKGLICKKWRRFCDAKHFIIIRIFF